MEIMQYATDSSKRSRNVVCWTFEFPNNRGASVRPSKKPFRFDIDFDLDGGIGEAVGLTTSEVEATLEDIASTDVET